MLGVDGICLIGHGSSNALAVQRAIHVVTECAQRQINDRIAADIKKYNI